MTLPYTGKEFLASLDDGRKVWIYGERVKNIAAHPAFQDCARMVARLYDALHEDHAAGRNARLTYGRRPVARGRSADWPLGHTRSRLTSASR